MSAPRGVFPVLLFGLLLALPVPAFAQPAQPAPAGFEGVESLPPRQFEAVDTFLEAIAVEDEAAFIIDSYWQPAIAALVAANPAKVEQARSFANGARRTELSMFRPLVAMTLDSNAIELLNPDVRARLERLRERQRAEYRPTPTVTSDGEAKFAREYRRIQSGPATRVNAELDAIAELARSTDGIALRDLMRSGLFICVDENTSGAAHSESEAECARLENSPVVKRLRKTRLGDRLIVVDGFVYSHLAGMAAMAHDAGISLYGLLPPEQVQAAGLNVPTDLSLDELVGRSAPSPGRPS